MKNNKNNIRQIIKNAILLVAIAIITIGATKAIYFLYEEATLYDMKKIDAKFGIDNKAGLAGDIDILNFGIVPPGSSSTREMLLYHEYKKPLLIRIKYSGNIREALLPIPDFYLEPNVERKITISAFAVRNYAMNYTGTVSILYLKQ